MRGVRLFWATGLVAVAGMVFGVSGALAQVPNNPQHGITLQKGCVGTTKVLDPMVCAYSVLNFTDGAQDTLTFDALVDVVHAAGGDVSSGDVFDLANPFNSTVQVKTTTTLLGTTPSGATCVATAGNGTTVPYTGVTSCTLPFPSSVFILPFSHYSVTAADFASANPLPNDVFLTWHDVCDGPGNDPPPNNCVANPPPTATASQTNIIKRNSATVTEIHNGAHAPVLVVAAGTTVHDKAIVSSTDGGPIPQGDVVFRWFSGTAGNECTTLLDTSGPFPLLPDGTVDATGFPKTPAAAGFFGFRAEYLGSGTYNGSMGACEPLQVVDARISIVQTDTNRVGDPHTFTVTVEQNDGTGWAPAVGVNVASTETGVGTITGGTCGAPATGPTDAAGQCTVTVNSATPGSSTVNASASVSVAGVNVPVATNGAGAFVVANVKTWVDARISIVQTDTNQVGDPHTFTVTVEQNDGTGWTPAVGVNVATTETGVGTITGGTCGAPATGPTDAAGQCTVTVNSATAGSSTVNASATVPAGGLMLPVATDGTGAFVVANVKTWVDARISIVQTDTNQVGDPHTFTVTVEKNDGTGWTPSGPGTVVSSTTDFGAITGGTCGPAGPTDAAGQCTVTVNSMIPGTATVNASATVAVGGLNIPVATNGAGAFVVSNQKTWVDARISIVQTETNRVGDPHTFTVTVEKNDGTGWTPAVGVNVASTETGVGTITGGTCGAPATGPTDAAGQCTVTVNSATPGSSTVNASATVPVGGLNINVATNGAGAFVVANVKTWVDARISIAQTDTNQVGDPHTFTVTVEQNDGTGWTPAVGVNVASTETGVGTITGGTCGAPATGPTDAAGQCTVAVNSAVTGSSTVNASATVPVGGLMLPVATDGIGAFTVSNVKTWVNARISIVQSDTNQVGDPHTFTVTVEKDEGAGFVPAVGVNVTTTETGVGTITGGSCGAPATGPTDAAGQCTVTVNSATPGSSTVNASATVDVNGVNVVIATDGAGAFVVSNVKTWVDARISIVQSDTNQVGDPHSFTVTVEQNDGTGWTPAVGVPVASTETGVGTITGGSCGAPATGPTDAAGQCTVTVNSATPGSSTVNASATVPVGGLMIAVATDGAGAFVVSNVKTWVDARISIVQTDTNQVGDPHTFTVTVEKNDGTGWTPAVGVNVASTESGVGNITGGSCGAPATGPTDAAGQCTVTVNSATPGSSTVNASATVPVGGLNIAVATNGAGAFTVSNVKTWVDARISIVQSDTNRVGDPHTFTVTVEQNDGTGWTPAVGVNVATTETGVGNITGGTCGAPATGPTDAAGQCTVTVNSAAPGSSTVNASATVPVGGLMIAVATNGAGAFTVSNVKAWVDARISIVQSDTNKVGDPHTFTVTVEQNDGTGWTPAVGVNVASTETGVGNITGGSCGAPATGPTDAAGQCTVTVNSAVVGSSTVNASATVPVGGLNVAVATDGAGAFVISNVKSWVDARISIVQTDTNQVNDPHTFTVTVEKNDGTGWTPAVGVNVATTETGVGTITGGTCGAPATGPTDAAGQCTVTVNSATPGSSTVNASANVPVGGINVAVATDGYGAFTIANVKSWVDARISITQTDTNEVGDPHTFTVTVEKNDGTGWTPAVGVNVATTTSFGSITGGTCGAPATGPTNASGQCTVTVNSPVAGQATVQASATVPVGGLNIAVATNGYGAFTVSNVKTWVDASIGIDPPQAVNPVGTNHTFTVTVRKNLGLGGGFVAAAGEHVDVNIVNSLGATATINLALSTCDDAGPNTDAAGQCILVISSPTAGTTTAFASVTLLLSGVSVTRDSNSGTAIPHGPGGTDEAVKDWEGGGGQITPTQVDCQMFSAGLAPDLTQFNYTLTKQNTIHQNINPGNSFFWTEITTTMVNQVVTVTQTNTSVNGAAPIQIHGGFGARLYQGDCSSWVAMTPNAANSGASITVATPGTYVIGIMYDPKSLVGTKAPSPADITYDFATSLGGATGASVLLKKK